MSGMTKIVGVLELSSKYRYGLTSRGSLIFLFRPYDITMPELLVGCSHRDLSRNQIAVVEAPEKIEPRQRANLLHLIGPVGDYDAEKKALLSYYCPSRNNLITPHIADESYDKHRIELSAETGWTTFHIDPPGCRDIDDAIAIHRSGKIAITIADASALSDENTRKTAREIGASFYSLDGEVEIPMLPLSISQDLASLLPGKRRRGLSLIIDTDGTETFSVSWITVAQSFTYDTFLTSPLCPVVDSHKYVENLMIRYNSAAARLLKESGHGLLRVQNPADAAEVKIWTDIDPTLALLANEAATYQAADPTADQPHASLQLAAYCHASSPIRRYADLHNQAILKAILYKRPLPEETDDSVHLNERTKANRRWTRDLTFLTHVRPGKVHTLDVVWTSPNQVWVAQWKRLLRLRHEQVEEPGFKGQIEIFCDPTRRNWKQRILTSTAS
jgi:exoribonuclease R